MLEHAWALLEVKSADLETRTITGIASTPTLDRQGHVFDTTGATFAKAVPLLLHHDRERPIGTAKLSTRVNAIHFEATLPTVTDPGPLRDRIEDAWQTVKAGLMRGASIGYRILSDGVEVLKDGNLRITKSEICELSLVTIPANAEASILTIKSLDLAAMGQPPTSPGVAGLPVIRAVKAAPPIMTTAEHVTQWSNTRAPKAARMAELMADASKTGVTLDAKATEEYDTLKIEVQGIDAHLVRLKEMETLQIAQAQPVAPVAAPAAAALVVQPRPIIQVKSNVPKGTAFIRMVQAKAACNGNAMQAVEWAKQWRDTTPEVELYLKAAVAPGTTTDAVWAGPLAAMTPLTTEFLELLRPATILGKVSGFMNVPFNVSVPSQTGGGTYGWVGQGAPKPVGKLQFGTITLGITKAAGIVVITEELARNSTPSAEAVIRADMIAGIAQFLDLEFIDPAKAAVANVSPGSITNGVTPITTAGTTPANARTDLVALMNAMTAAGIPLSGATLIMSETNALALAAALNPLGQPLFPLVNISGGTGPFGVSIVTSQAAGSNVILVAAPCILYADDGGVTIDVSREASVQMDSAPDNPGVATTVLTSLWQNNLVGLRAERFINWKKARAGCVQYTVATYAA